MTAPNSNGTAATLFDMLVWTENVTWVSTPMESYSQLMGAEGRQTGFLQGRAPGLVIQSQIFHPKHMSNTRWAQLVCVWIYGVYACEYMYNVWYRCVQIYMCEHMSVNICMCVYVCKYMYMCICVNIYICVYVCTHVCVYKYMYVWIYVCVCLRSWTCEGVGDEGRVGGGGRSD